MYIHISYNESSVIGCFKRIFIRCSHMTSSTNSVRPTIYDWNDRNLRQCTAVKITRIGIAVVLKTHEANILESMPTFLYYWLKYYDNFNENRDLDFKDRFLYGCSITRVRFHLWAWMHRSIAHIWVNFNDRPAWLLQDMFCRRTVVY